MVTQTLRNIDPSILAFPWAKPGRNLGSLVFCLWAPALSLSVLGWLCGLVSHSGLLAYNVPLELSAAEQTDCVGGTVSFPVCDKLLSSLLSLLPAALLVNLSRHPNPSLAHHQRGLCLHWTVTPGPLSCRDQPPAA